MRFLLKKHELKIMFVVQIPGSLALDLTLTALYRINYNIMFSILFIVIAGKKIKILWHSMNLFCLNSFVTRS